MSFGVKTQSEKSLDKYYWNILVTATAHGMKSSSTESSSLWDTSVICNTGLCLLGSFGLSVSTCLTLSHVAFCVNARRPEYTQTSLCGLATKNLFFFSPQLHHQHRNHCVCCGHAWPGCPPSPWLSMLCFHLQCQCSGYIPRSLARRRGVAEAVGYILWHHARSPPKGLTRESELKTWSQNFIFLFIYL